ncbi:MAG: serine/threonine protein kinase [Clostridia bacterium]|nr:serine/threonine protein kinase [Clostridia bacterium]
MNEVIAYLWLEHGTILKDLYQIKRKLSISELSIVYIGWDLKENKELIIKEYYPKKLALRDLDKKTVLCRQTSLKDEYYKSRDIFLNEAIILKAYNHKNIAKYIDHFEENNTGYIIMEHHEGKTLDEYMREEREISISGFMKSILIPLVNAVNELHKKGIIHRDIKPNNIVVDKNNNPIVIDFGSAIHFKKCAWKKIFVTPGFSPIEFYSEKAKQGKFSDVYSLAATLYYYLCGKAPIEATERIIEDEIEHIRSYNKEISYLFSKIIMKNLSVDYKRRFSSLRLFKIFCYLEYFHLKAKKV